MSRPVAFGVSFRRLANVARPAGCRGVQDRPSSREDADEADGDRGALSPSAYDEARAGAQDLSVSAARHRDRTTKPGVGDGYHLHPDGAWLRLSGRCARFVQPSRAVVAGGAPHGGGEFRCKSWRGLLAPRPNGYLPKTPHAATEQS